MVQLDQEVVEVTLAVYVQLLCGQSEIGLELVNQGKVAEDHGVVIRVLTAALALIVAKKEGAVFNDGAAESNAKLVLPQLVQPRGRQFTFRLHRIIAEISIERAMKVIGPACGNDVDDPADGASGFNAIGVVDYAKLAHRVSGGRGLLHARGCGHIVRAVNGDKVVVNVLPGKGELGHRFNDHIGAAGSGIADCNARREQREINELTAIHRQIIDLR